MISNDREWNNGTRRKKENRHTKGLSIVVDVDYHHYGVCKIKYGETDQKLFENIERLCERWREKNWKIEKQDIGV